MSRNCYAPGCSTGNSKEKKYNLLNGIRNKSIFKAPKDPELLNKWAKAIPRKDKVLTPNCGVCELHFLEGDIEKYYEIKLPCGKVDKIEKGKPTLKYKAIPTIFPNLPSYLSTAPANKRKSPQKKPENFICTKRPKLQLLAIDSTKATGNTQVQYSETSRLNFKLLLDLRDKIHKPDNKWTCGLLPNHIYYVRWELGSEKKITIDENLKIQIFLNNSEISLQSLNFDEITCIKDLNACIKKVHDFIICQGTLMLPNNMIGKSNLCKGYIIRQDGQRGFLSKSCFECRLDRKRMADKYRNKILKPYFKKNKQNQNTAKSLKRKNARLRIKVNQMRSNVDYLKKECATKNLEPIMKAIKLLPNSQQEAVKACLDASKVSRANGRRYTLNWIYECILIRIKSRKTYEHLRIHGILPLPTIETLQKYLLHTKGVYGFQSSTFASLKEKSFHMKPEERRGTLLLDEMKVSEQLVFDKKTLKINGFTDLGKHTPEHQKNVRGDHALVIMFQPFRGTWVQAVACFLSKGAANSSVLHQIIIEAIVLLEKSGFFVDVVTTDGAQWNRSMWNKFGITESIVSCEHICDEKRRLWFMSDFPHLIKNFRNSLIKRRETWTPEGGIKIKHWEAVVDEEKLFDYSLKVSKLQHEDIHPKFYQKMNVGRAFRFFSNDTAIAMELYSATNVNLKDCNNSIVLINKVNTLIKAMNSRTPRQALKINSIEEKCIKDFYIYLTDWETRAKSLNYEFITDNTCYGLKVSLKASLELLQFLVNECGYTYLMTSRLNQDALERFFGMMRSTCGSNDHPDSVLFIQMFRLISTYSLIKPPKNSNVTGGEMIETLINIQDLSNVNVTKDTLEGELDSIIDKGQFEELPDVIALMHDHDYRSTSTSSQVLSYLAGYIARKANRFTKCKKCLSSLRNDCLSSSRDKLLDMRSKGNLIHSSNNLFSLISTLEKSTLKALKNEELNMNTLLTITEMIEQGDSIQLVGCVDHKEEFSKAIVRFFLIMRMCFIVKRANYKDTMTSKEKTKKNRKVSKL